MDVQHRHSPTPIGLVQSGYQQSKIGMMRFSSALLSFAAFFVVLSSAKPLIRSIRAPSVFRSDEAEMHRFSAVLAVTEPFRELCTQQVRDALGLTASWACRLLGRPVISVGAQHRAKNEAVDVALSRFETRVQNIVRSYGMSVEEFNHLSSTISKFPSLKRKVMLQAFLYKVAADVESNTKGALFTLPAINANTNSRAQRRHTFAIIDPSIASPQGNTTRLVRDEDRQLTKFATALLNVENQRLSLRETLKRDLNVNNLPAKMSDPDVLPTLAQPIQQACQQFPLIAAQIIGRCGLQIEEFNALQEKMYKNIFFRYSVQREIRQIESKAELT